MKQRISEPGVIVADLSPDHPRMLPSIPPMLSGRLVAIGNNSSWERTSTARPCCPVPGSLEQGHGSRRDGTVGRQPCAFALLVSKSVNADHLSAHGQGSSSLKRHEKSKASQRPRSEQPAVFPRSEGPAHKYLALSNMRMCLTIANVDARLSASSAFRKRSKVSRAFPGFPPLPLGVQDHSTSRRFCSRRARDSSRKSRQVPPLSAFREATDLPALVFGPVAFSQGRHCRISSAWRARRSGVQPFAIFLLQ
jgi:hypothetical protein